MSSLRRGPYFRGSLYTSLCLKKVCTSSICDERIDSGPRKKPYIRYLPLRNHLLSGHYPVHVLLRQLSAHAMTGPSASAWSDIMVMMMQCAIPKNLIVTE